MTARRFLVCWHYMYCVVVKGVKKYVPAVLGLQRGVEIIILKLLKMGVF